MSDRNLHYHITVKRDEDDGYVARAKEFPFLAGAEETPERAEAILREAIALAIAANPPHTIGTSLPENPLSASDEIVQIADGQTSIFAAMGLADAEEMTEKADLVFAITRAYQASGLNQRRVAKRVAITPADMSRIVRGRTENVSIARLESILRAFGAYEREQPHNAS